MAYADAVKDIELNLKATVDALDESINVDVANLDFKNKANTLKDKLNQESIRHQDALKASYLALSTDPCSNSERHYKLIESITQKNYQLQELRESLKTQRNRDSLVSSASIGVINDYMYERGKREGQAMRQIVNALSLYRKSNSKYPEKLEELDCGNSILTLGLSRLDYRRISDTEYTLRFAGEDFALGTSDDRLYSSEDEHVEIIEDDSSNQNNSGKLERIERNRIINQTKEKVIRDVRFKVKNNYRHRLSDSGGSFNRIAVEGQIDKYLRSTGSENGSLDNDNEYFTYNGASLEFTDLPELNYGPVVGYHFKNGIVSIILFTETSYQVIQKSGLENIDYDKLEDFLVEKYNQELDKLISE